MPSWGNPRNLSQDGRMLSWIRRNEGTRNGVQPTLFLYTLTFSPGVALSLNPFSLGTFPHHPHFMGSSGLFRQSWVSGYLPLKRPHCSVATGEGTDLVTLAIRQRQRFWSRTLHQNGLSGLCSITTRVFTGRARLSGFQAQFRARSPRLRWLRL